MPQKAYSWLHLDYRWPNKAWPEELRRDLIETLVDLEDRSADDLFWYKAECTPNAAMVTRCIGGVPGAAVFRRTDEKLEFLRDLAGSTNHVVLQVLDDVSKLPFWVLSTDYVQDEVIGRIIALNDNADVVLAPLDVTGATDLDSVYTGSHRTPSILSAEAPLKRTSKTIQVRETGL